MSRIIKFRAWNTDEKCMEYGDGLFEFTGVIHELMDYVKSPAIHGTKIGRMFNGKIMQFTGLKDKNGVEIFEGDILQSYPIPDVTFTVCFGWNTDKNALGWCLKSNRHTFSMDKCVEIMEIIGNLYSTPELLK